MIDGLTINVDPEKFFYRRKKVHGWDRGEAITLSSRLIIQAAEELGVEWRSLPGTHIIELKYNGKTRHYRYQISGQTTDVGFYSCLDKSVTNNLLQAAGIRTAKGYNLIRSDQEDYWMEVYNALQKPLVVKPTHGNQGNEITLGVNDPEAYKEAVRRSFAFLNAKRAGVIVEETFVGKEYRLLTTREKVVGALYRMPANVVGDGKSTIEQLLEVKNSDPRRGSDDTFALFKIKIDDSLLDYLTEQGLSLQSVPKEGERIFVRRVSNIAKGGDSIDMTDVMHPSVAEYAVRAVNAIPGLDFAGVDFMTHDISQPQTDESYCIIEVNTSPGFCIQEFPYEGKPRNGGKEFIYILFPELKPA